MHRMFRGIALLVLVAGCGIRSNLTDEEVALMKSCDGGDYAACSDMAHLVASDRPDTQYMASKN